VLLVEVKRYDKLRVYGTVNTVDDEKNTDVVDAGE
jgi:hypothetical protein